MIELPPVPSWNALHPLIVHIPIGVLLVVPLFLLVGALLREKGRCWLMAGLMLMILGTGSAYLSVETGEAAARLVQKTPEMAQVLDRHEDLAEATRLVFTLLTAVFALLLFLPRWIRREPKGVSALLVNAAFLLAYMCGTLVLAATGHAGGRLVHEFGVRANTASSPGR